MTPNTHFKLIDPAAFDRQGVRGCYAVVGAGIAGLSAARQLEKLGHKAAVFERGDRIGGRLLSLAMKNGAQIEAGGMRIPSTHEATMDYVRELGLETRPFINSNKNAFYYFNGVRSRIGDDPHKLYESFDLNTKRLVQRRRKAKQLSGPAEELSELMAQSLQSLSEAERAELYADRLTERTLRDLDDVTLRDHLNRFASPDFVEALMELRGLNEYADYSAKAGLIDAAGLYENPSYVEIVGGMRALIEGVASELKGEIRLRTEVTEIEVSNTGVFIRGNRSGEPFEHVFDGVIIATPPRAAAGITFKPELSLAKRRALRGLMLASAHKTLIGVSARFWEIEDQIAGGGSFTDLPSQQLWYPSDNAMQDPEKETGTFIPMNRDISHAPSAFTAAYTWGARARLFASMSEGERDEQVLSDLMKIHGKWALNYVTEIRHHVWDQQPGFGGGAFAYFASGQHGRHQEALVAPHGLPGRSPSVFFAGEYVGIAHAWIQPALQTAHKAVAGLVSSPLRETLIA